MEAEVLASRPAPPPPPDDDDDEPFSTAVAPLRWAGPYPALALRFPELATAAQKERGERGVTLDFVVDTAASVNTISAPVASELALRRVGAAPDGVGAGGALAGGDIFALGECELGDKPAAERFTFMTGLTAAALQVASPANAGILGVAFLNCFPGGVEFRWGDPSAAGAASANVLAVDGAPNDAAADGSALPEWAPQLTFYGEDAPAEATAGLRAFAVRALPDSRLPVVELLVNGVAVPALLDTGSPITVLNAAAAAAAGVVAPPAPAPAGAAGGGGNVLSRMRSNFEAAQAAARGDVLMIGGADGPVSLMRATEPAAFSLGDGAAFGDGSRCYVGDLPGLAALDGLGADAGPAAVLGTDVLRRRPRMVYRASEVLL